MSKIEIAVRLIGPVVILIGICISAFLVIRQMKMQNRTNRRTKALTYSLYSNEHLRDSRLKIEQAFGSMFSLNEPIPMAEIEKKIEEDPEILSSIFTLLAHWENMSLAIYAGIADDGVCYEMVASTLNQHVKIFRNFIEDRRKNNPRIYYHLTELRRRWEERLGDVHVLSFKPVMEDRSETN